MKRLTVGELIAELQRLVESGSVSLDDKMAIPNNWNRADPVDAIVPMTGFTDTDDGAFEFRGDLEPKETRRLVFVYGD